MSLDQAFGASFSGQPLREGSLPCVKSQSYKYVNARQGLQSKEEKNSFYPLSPISYLEGVRRHENLGVGYKMFQFFGTSIL